MSKEQTAKKERFLREVERQLLRKGLDSEMMEGGILNVKWHGQLLCDVDGDGVVCFPSKTVRGVDADASLQTVIQIASQVREYMPIFARAPALKAIGLEGSYKILADFGDAVLAGRLGKKGANFVTWEWDFDRNGVHMGHYFIEDYEDAAHHNAVFIGTDEGNCPRHAHLRSTNSFGKAFRLNVESSDPRYSFHHTGTDGSLYVFEAPIDMLSYISMNPHQWQEHSYVACCGTSPIPVMQMLKPNTQIVYLCLDNDDAGHKASERMAELLHERGVMTERLVPELKDWNDDLLHIQKEELTPCLSL